MRNILFLFISFVLITSCEDKKNENKTFLSESSGKINTISIVVDNDLWEGKVGEAIRNTFATPINGLPQDEPMFTISQIPPSVFSGFATKNRTVLKIEKGNEASVKTASNVFAKPQKVVVITGKTDNEIINQLKLNTQKITSTFKKEEIKEKQRRINLSLYKNHKLKETLGISINFPTAYRIAKETDNFYWIRKDITTGTTNLMIYELPLDVIKRGDSLINQIIKIRDSIGITHIRGRLDGETDKNGETISSYMITEKAYSPFLVETIIDNKPAIEVKGLWELKNDFMGGPFLSYLIEDKMNNRLVVAEGFAFAPSVEKRDYMFELEAIIKSIKIN